MQIKILLKYKKKPLLISKAWIKRLKKSKISKAKSFENRYFSIDCKDNYFLSWSNSELKNGFFTIYNKWINKLNPKNHLYTKLSFIYSNIIEIELRKSNKVFCIAINNKIPKCSTLGIFLILKSNFIFYYFSKNSTFFYGGFFNEIEFFSFLINVLTWSFFFCYLYIS